MIQILLIEDDIHIAGEIQYFLNSAGFEVEHADTAKEAMRILEERKYHLIILDVTLPDANGFELFEQIKSERETPVIFLTALDEEEDIVRGFDLGADEYITKPFRPRELLSRVKNVIKHAGIQEESRKSIQIGQVRIDLEQATVYKNEKNVEVTALEYKILMLLFENRGRILTRTQILANIWDDSGNFVNDNTLTVYIKRLRERIEDDPNQPKIIQTVRGMGYKVV